MPTFPAFRPIGQSALLAACLALCAACRAGKGDGSKPVAQTAQAETREPPPAPLPTADAPARAAPCFVDAGTAAGNAIRLALSASRTHGVAPLAVFFDTAGTNAVLAPRPFHDLAYCWDFADPGSGSFAWTGRSKNRAFGAVASHVFEKPGVYAVRLSARDRTGRTATRTIEIHVDDPGSVFRGEATVCFSGRGDFSGCPQGARHVTTSKLEELVAHVAPGRRLLLRRGEGFVGTTVTLNTPGPGIVGAFGAGKPPHITANASLFVVSNRTPRFADWRITDLFVDGRGRDVHAVTVEGKARDLLVLRLGATGVGAGVVAGDSIIDYWNHNGYPGNDVIDGLTVQDCDMQKLAQGGGVFAYIAAHRLSLLGNRFHDSKGGEHALRTPWIDRGVVSNNDLGEIPKEKHVLQIHGPSFARPGIGRGRYTERVVFSDNIFRGTGELDWTLFIGPQNLESDERLRDLVFERNLFLPGGRVLQVGLVLAGPVVDTTVRNNIFVQGRAGTCVKLLPGGSTPGLPARIVLAENTCVGSNGPTLVEAAKDITNPDAHNNLVAGPAARLFDEGMRQVDEAAGNLALPATDLVAPAPASWRDARPRRGSKAIDGAKREHATAWDFTGTPRPLDGDSSGGAQPDVGAIELEPEHARNTDARPAAQQ